mmetsp:Transcript_64402/g.158481  ORF Transcript_64402/g.158481 Transcript_64402/m.158481 type:complete len:201 (+) Transcript_64402:662-1264(+)
MALCQIHQPRGGGLDEVLEDPVRRLVVHALDPLLLPPALDPRLDEVLEGRVPHGPERHVVGRELPVVDRDVEGHEALRLLLPREDLEALHRFLLERRVPRVPRQRPELQLDRRNLSEDGRSSGPPRRVPLATSQADRGKGQPRRSVECPCEARAHIVRLVEQPLVTRVEIARELVRRYQPAQHADGRLEEGHVLPHAVEV